VLHTSRKIGAGVPGNSLRHTESYVSICPTFDGVVRRTGPAGLNGWLTVLAEDEVLGLYQTFQGLQPRQARRYHVNHAGATLATVIDNLILIGDVTDQALQFDLGSMAKA